MNINKNNKDVEGNVVGSGGEGNVVGSGSEGEGNVVGSGSGGEGIVVESGGGRKGFRRRLRDFIVNNSVEFIKWTGVPLDLACLMLKIFHFRTPFDLLFYAVFGNVFYGMCLWVLSICIFSLFFLLDGCVLSVIEYKLTGNSSNVMDVFLWLAGYEFNYTNRYYATIIAAVIYLLTFFGIVFYRGGFRVEHLNRLIYYLSFTYLPNFFSSGLAADTHASFYN